MIAPTQTFEELASVTLPTPLGIMRATADRCGIRSLEFESVVPARRTSSVTQPHLELLRAELSRYFAGELREFTVPLDPHGTAFQMRVWEQLRGIQYGATISYRELARRVGNAQASRAVGAANGANPICIIIPCHRVIAADGSLGGYSAGLRRKERLLALELTGRLPRA